MKTIVIKYNMKENFIKEPIIQKLLWYDNLKKELLEFEGTKFEFEYKQDPYILSMDEDEKKEKGIKTAYRSFPKPVLEEVVNYKKKEITSNKKDVIKFFKDYLNYNNTNIVINNEYMDGIDFSVPEEEIDDFAYQIERKGFKFEIN